MSDIDKQYKVLIIAPDLPYPIRAGGQMRMASIFLGLSKFVTFHISCIAPSIPPNTLAWITDIGGTITNFARGPISRFHLWAFRFKSIISRNILHFDSEEHRFFKHEIDIFNPDIIWLETPYLLRYAINLRDSIPLIVDYWGNSTGQKRDFSYANGLRKIWGWLRWRAYFRAECKYAPLIRNIVTISRLDADFFRKIAPNNRIWAIPSGIINDAKTNLEISKLTDPNVLIMTGDMSYRPNVDAAIYFVRNIFPIILSFLPQARIKLVGRNPCSEINLLARNPGVYVEGFVPDLSIEISKAAVYVLPMRLGSGIRSKLFDVFPVGIPIVTTSIGAEGLELVNNENCLIADTSEDFAQACVLLLKNEEKRRHLGQNMRRLAFKIYSQDNVNQSLKSLLTDILSNKSKPS